MGRVRNVNLGGRVSYQSSLTAETVHVRDMILTQLGGFNDSLGAIYVQIYDANVIPPAASTNSFMRFYVPAGASFAWKPSREGRLLLTGLTFTVSSTRDAYTPDATTIFFFAEGYEF